MIRRDLNLQADVHRRYNPLSGEWVLVSPHRTARPWQGQTETVGAATSVQYDPDCYLCPGNVRANGEKNPQYDSTFAFDNDFAALLSEGGHGEIDIDGLLQARAESGLCRVLCYSPRHDLSLGQLSVAGIGQVIDTWTSEYRSLGARPRVNAVTIFENRGAMMGASNPHPHGQIWANETTPEAVLRESAAQEQYIRKHNSCLLCDYAALESGRGERLVCANQHFMAVVPFWATWPFETMVLPRMHVGDLDGLSAAARDSFARILKDLVSRYDALFETSFPYSMGLHQRPTDGLVHSQWHLHGHFYPPLLRSASVRKFMVGYEMLAGPQRDITPEIAAERLRGKQ